MADSFKVVFGGVKEFERAIEVMIAKVDVAAREAVTKGGHLIEAKSKEQFSGAHAKGQPHVGGNAPNVVTGTARRSIHGDSITHIGFGTWQSLTGPSVVYGRRLELGFNGVDALGRVYDTQGYPYMQPGFDEAKPELPRIFAEAWGAALR